MYLFFSVGMEEQQLIERYKRQVDIEEYNAIAGNITVDDTWEDLNTSYMRKQIALYQPDYIIIDYIQVMTCNHPSMDRKTEMQAILRELKTLANDCKISVIGMTRLKIFYKDSASYFLSPDIFRELLSDNLEDINLTYIHRDDHFRIYEYDSNGEVAFSKTKFITYHDNNPEILEVQLENNRKLLKSLNEKLAIAQKKQKSFTTMIDNLKTEKDRLEDELRSLRAMQANSESISTEIARKIQNLEY